MALSDDFWENDMFEDYLDNQQEVTRTKNRRYSCDSQSSAVRNYANVLRTDNRKQEVDENYVARGYKLHLIHRHVVNTLVEKVIDFKRINTFIASERSFYETLESIHANCQDLIKGFQLFNKELELADKNDSNTNGEPSQLPESQEDETTLNEHQLSIYDNLEMKSNHSSHDKNEEHPNNSLFSEATFKLCSQEKPKRDKTNKENEKVNADLKILNGLTLSSSSCCSWSSWTSCSTRITPEMKDESCEANSELLMMTGKEESINGFNSSSTDFLEDMEETKPKLPVIIVTKNLKVTLSYKMRELLDSMISQNLTRVSVNSRELLDATSPMKIKKRKLYSSSSSDSESTIPNYELVKELRSEVPQNDDNFDMQETIELSGIGEWKSNSSTTSSDDEKKESKLKEIKIEAASAAKKQKISPDSDDSATSVKPRPSWQNDHLLTFKLSSTDSEADFKEKPKPTEGKLKRRRPRRRRRGSQPSTETSSISSDSSNESLNLESEARNSFECVVINDSDEDDTPTKSRKKIKNVLSEEKLSVTTKSANEQEKLRVGRLKKHKEALASALRQHGFRETDGLILDSTSSCTILVNKYITQRLKRNQIEGVKFMWDSCYESISQLKNHPGGGCIIAHCMGLGKTFQVVALIHTLFSYRVTNTRHVLIICPVSTVLNWKRELTFGITLSQRPACFKMFTISDYGGKEGRFQTIMNWWCHNGVLIMGYETYTALLKAASSTKQREALIGADLVVCDEGHLLKNDKASRTQALMSLKTKRRIILTGTPLQNNLQEYYHMVQFIKPNLLGSTKEYRNRFVNPIVNGQYDDSTPHDIHLMKKRSHVLHSILKDTVQRYEVTELEDYLPRKHDYVIFLAMHKIQIVMYKYCIEKYRGLERNLFSHYDVLKLVWTHPGLLRIKEMRKQRQKVKELPTNNMTDVNGDGDPKFENDLPIDWWKQFVPEGDGVQYGTKMEIMLKIVEESIKVNDKILIFSSSVTEIQGIVKYLKLYFNWIEERQFLKMDGSVPVDKRQAYCNRFNDANALKVFIISHKVGSMGLNLAAANRVILMDVAWNPAYDTQSIFRVYRLGQTKQCFVYRLVAKGTMEEVLYERSITKQAVAGRVVDDLQISRHYKCQDLLTMYRCALDSYERHTHKLPYDKILATILQKCDQILGYNEHQNMLVNLPHEKLNEEEMQLAWDEFNREQEAEQNNPHIINRYHEENFNIFQPGTPELVTVPAINPNNVTIPPTRPTIRPPQSVSVQGGTKLPPRLPILPGYSYDPTKSYHIPQDIQIVDVSDDD